MNNIARNIGLTLFSSVGMNLIGLLTGILLARSLGPAGRGMMTAVLIWPQMLVWAGGLSLGYANVYHGAAEPKMRRAIFANSLWTALALGAGVGAIALLVLPRLVPMTATQHGLLTVSLVLLPLSLLADYAGSVLLGMSCFGWVNGIRLAGPLVTAAGLIVLGASHALDVRTAVLATWAGAGVQAVLTLGVLARKRLLSVTPDVPLLRRSLGYAARVHVGTLAGLANGRLDQLIMTAIVAPKSLGLYAFAVTLSEMLNVAASAVSLVLFPEAAGEADHAGGGAVAARSARWVLLLGVSGGIVLAILAPQFIHLIWGDRFLSALPAVYALLPGTVLLGVAGPLCAGLRGAGRPLAGTAAEVASLAVMVPLLLALLHRYGIFGAGLASTCGYTVYFLVIVHHFSRSFGPDALAEVRPTARDWHDVQRLARAGRGGTR